MADLLTADEIEKYREGPCRIPWTRTAEIDNAAISLTQIADLVVSWPSIKFSLFNKHPAERDGLDIPTCSLIVSNKGRFFTLGNAAGAFPNGASDLATTTVRITFGAPGRTHLDYTGILKGAPRYRDDQTVEIPLDHYLVKIAQRVWRREDRIGGDLGYSISIPD